MQTRFVNLLCLIFEVVFLSLGRLFENDTLRTPDNNALKNVSYSGRKVVAWATEEKPECLNLVKNVKNSEKCKFVSVLTTGIVASITKFFTKVIPKTLYNHEKLYHLSLAEQLSSAQRYDDGDPSFDRLSHLGLHETRSTRKQTDSSHL